MAIDYSVFALPKGTPLIVSKLARKQNLASQERACRAAVQQRDHGRCVVPGCKDAGPHKHHITYRSRGGKWCTDNICSLCPTHHQLVHAGLLQISGNADQCLNFTGHAKYLLRAGL